MNPTSTNNWISPRRWLTVVFVVEYDDDDYSYKDDYDDNGKDDDDNDARWFISFIGVNFRTTTTFISLIIIAMSFILVAISTADNLRESLPDKEIRSREGQRLNVYMDVRRRRRWRGYYDAQSKPQ